MMSTVTGKCLIYTGMVEEICAEWEESQFDACLCDPPYLLQFMGKEFDKQHLKMSGANQGQKMQAWHERWTREVLRVLKPGAHMLAFGGTRTYHRLASAAEDVGFEVRDMLAWMHGQGFPKGKTQLKPAHEPVLLARAPGARGELGIDSCRITCDWSTDPTRRGWQGRKAPDRGMFSDGKNIRAEHSQPHEGGRWPANLILSHHPDCIDDGECHPDCPVRMLDEQSGITKSGIQTKPNPRSGGGLFKTVKGEAPEGPQYEDRGGASRFFYCAKVSTRERNLGRIDCRHPTLKPIALTTYLARLLLPPPSSVPRRILVPFSGAGSEIIGALLAGWDQVIGVEMDTEYISWSRARIKAVRNGEFKS